MNSIVQQLLLQFILIALNAFFASAEIAVLSLNPTKLRKLEEEGDKKAPKLLKLLEEPSGFLSTIQIGITLAGFLGSAFAADNFSEYLVKWIYEDLHFNMLSRETIDVAAVIIITLILSYFTLVLGELVPKRIAMQKSMEISRFSYNIIAVVAKIMKPIVVFLSLSTDGLLHLLHMKTNTEEATATEEEIRMMVEMSSEQGNIEQEEEECIQNVFDFHESVVEDIMTRVAQVVTVRISASKTEVLQVIKESGLSRFPIVGESKDEVVGILNAREMLLYEGENWHEIIRSAYFVPEAMRAEALFKNLQKQRIHLAIVVDEYGQVAGIITMEDLLEEIVGNIYDEFDQVQKDEIEAIGEKIWRVKGSVDIDTLNETIHTNLPEGEGYSTLSGLIYAYTQAIPSDGETFEVIIDNMKLQVLEVKNRRIEMIQLSYVS